MKRNMKRFVLAAVLLFSAACLTVSISGCGRVVGELECPGCGMIYEAHSGLPGQWSDHPRCPECQTPMNWTKRNR